jgi:phage baseplate assembly protein W
MKREFLGTGWKFPIRVDPRGGLAFSSGEQDVQEAIWVILSTARGERQMRPDFGCGIQDYVFAPNNTSTRSNIAQQVRQALTHWEPRIDVQNVRVESSPDEENKLLIRIDYRIRSGNTSHNLVYPFYIQESGAA